MGEFQHVRDGTIVIRPDTGTVYIDTTANFILDGGPQPQLPPDIDERVYTQGKRHALLKECNVMDGGPRPWPDGDALIAKCQTYIAAQTARREAEANEMKAQFEEQLRKASIGT